MNILFVDQFSEPGGAQLCLRDLMPEILRRGWQSRLMTPGNGLPLRPCANGRKTAGDFLRYSLDVPRMAAVIRRVVREDRIDLVYVNGPRVLPAAADAGCPVLFHAHSRVTTFYGRRLVARALAASGAAVIAVSQFIARDYPGAHVVYNGVPDLEGPPRTFDRQPARVGILGRIAPEKGHLDFVRAARRITGAEFFVYGERMFADEAYDRVVRTLGERASVHFRGWTSDVGRALHDLDILAAPSGPNEGATRAIPEAFSAGTPVVAYRAGGIPEIVDHGRTGILTATSDFDSLAAAIGGLIENPELRKRLSAEARKEWQERFKMEKFRTAVCDRIAEHATTDKRRARSAPESGDDAAIARPAPQDSGSRARGASGTGAA